MDQEGLADEDVSSYFGLVEHIVLAHNLKILVNYCHSNSICHKLA